MEGTTTTGYSLFDSALRESEHRHELLFSGAPAAMLVFDVDTLRILAANDAALTLYGYSRVEILARTMPELRYQERRGFWRSHSALRAGHNVFEVSRHVRRDGTVFDIEIRTTSVPGLGSRIRLALINDVTTQKQIVDAARFLDKATGILSSSLEMGMVCRHLAVLAVPTLGEWCVVHLPDERGGLSFCSFAHANPLQQGILAQAVEQRGIPGDAHPASRAWRTGLTQVVANNVADEIFRTATSPRSDELTRHLGGTEALYVPLLGRAGTLGVLECVSGTPATSRCGSTRMLAEALAERASLAIDNALLYADSRRTTRTLQASQSSPEAAATQVLERIPEGCMLLSSDFTLTYLNAEAERMVQRPRGEMIGGVLWDLFPGLKVDPFQCAYERAMHERVDVAFDAWYEGLSTWYRIHARPWGDGIAVFFHDIGPQHHTMQRAEESEACFSDFLESATDLVHMLSSDGRILYANKAWRDKLGYTAQEVTELRMLDVVTPDCREAARDAFVRCISGEGAVESEMTVTAKDGRHVAVRGKANCRFVDGRPVSTRGIYRDVTGEVESAELLQRARRTEASATRAKTAFLDRVSHELRTPLAAIIGFADLLTHNRDGRLSPTELNFVQRIGAQGRSLLLLVEDVLAYADIESRRVDFDLMTVNLASLLREVADLYGSDAERAGVALVVDAPATVMLDTDAATLRRILRYLLDDAIKRGGGVKVSLTLLVDDESGAPGAIEVSDSRDDDETSAAASADVERATALELGLTVARSLCQLLGYHFSMRAGKDGSTVRRIELRGAGARDTRVEDETATTLHAFLQASPLPIVAFEPDWTVRIWNTAAARLFGWTSVEVIEKRLPLLRSEDEGSFRELLRAALESASGIADVPAVHLKSDGSTIGVHVSIAPLRTIDGRL
ncbi:MAG: hypothetical protein JWM95_1877, partial [Gemmatimonadetes bacterium]|nr:hypothetical protein [Gemmatimonadota bacterium]